MKSSGRKIELASASDLFSTEQERQDAKLERLQHIPLSELYLAGTSGTGGTVIGQKVTGANGIAMWTGLEPGAYVIEEVDPADGYSIINSSETVYLADNGEQSVITVRFDNMPDGNLLIRKVCATNPSVTLQNAEFKIMYADGRLIGDSNGIYRTDENGEIRIEGLEPGKSVIVTEVKAPAGFILDTQSQTIQIKEGRTVSLTFKNQPKSASVIACVLYFPMLIFSGATLPFEVMPEVMQRIISVFPMTQGIQFMKATFVGISVEHLALPIIVMLSVTFFCSVIAIKCFKWE